MLEKIMKEVVSIGARMDQIEKTLNDNFGPGTILKVKGEKDHDEGYTAIVLKIPGHGFALMNLAGEVNSILTCPSCNEEGHIHSQNEKEGLLACNTIEYKEKEDDAFKGEEDDDDDDDDWDESDVTEADLKETPRTYDTLVELYGEITCKPTGTLIERL